MSARSRADQDESVLEVLVSRYWFPLEDPLLIRRYFEVQGLLKFRGGERVKRSRIVSHCFQKLITLCRSRGVLYMCWT